MNEARVLIIIVTFNKKDYVAALLRSLARLAYTNHELVVVDNASSDGTVELLAAEFPGLKVIRNPENTGGSGGFNTGLAHAYGLAGYDYLWLLDNDVEVAPDALSRLVEVLEKNPEIAVAGSQMCQLDNPAVTNEIGAYVDLHRGGLVLNRHLTRRRNNASGLFDVDYVAAASLLIRFEVAKKAGLWEDFFIHFDDVDWCLTIKKMGHRVVGVADSLIWHVSAAEKPITWAMYYDVRNMLFLLEKHATRDDVLRFARRKIAQALVLELRGLSPLASLVSEAIGDFVLNRKGKKAISFPEIVSTEKLQGSQPRRGVLVCISEHFDPHCFPLDAPSLPPVTELLLPPYLVDTDFYWERRGGAPLARRGRLGNLLFACLGLFTGHRRFRRAYVDLRSSPYYAALLAEELAVSLGDGSWLLIRRDPVTVWKNICRLLARGVRQYWKI